MDSYSYFASVYDYLMEDFDYDEVFSFFIDKVNPKKDESILELACGTGEMSLRLSDAADLTCLDISESMLQIASEKARKAYLKATHVAADMTSLELGRKFDVVVSFLDGYNYLTKEDDLLKSFSSVYEHLTEGGRFFFDMSSMHKLKDVIGDATYYETHDDFDYVWDNYYDEDRDVLDFDFIIYKMDNGKYEKLVESHSQRAYEPKIVTELMKKAGFCDAEYFDHIDRIYYKGIK